MIYYVIAVNKKHRITMRHIDSLSIL